MRFFQVVLSGAALINAAMAAISFTSTPTAVRAGESVKITWTATGTGAVTILLRKGPADNLGAGVPITTTGSNGEFTWAVPSNLANGADYAFEIKQGSDNNFSGQFSISGGTGQVSSSAASSSATPTSSRATSSASASVSSPASSGTAVSSSASTNGTVTSATLSRTASSTVRPTGSATGTGGVPESTGAASTLITSPLALIFGAVAAMAYLN